MRATLQLLGLMMLVGLVALATPADAQNNTWKQPFQISEPATSGAAWLPDLAVDSNGVVHITYCGIPTALRQQGVQQAAIFYRAHTIDGWSKSNPIYALRGFDSSAASRLFCTSVASGRDGLLHLLVGEGSLGQQYLAAPLAEAWTARAWPEPTMVGGGAFGALASDTNGILHMLVSEGEMRDPAQVNATCASCSELFYRRSHDGGTTWANRVNLSGMAGGESGQQLAVDRQGRIHVVWDHGLEFVKGDIFGAPEGGFYRQSVDQGATWSPAVALGLPGERSHQIALGVTATGNPLVVYREQTSNRLIYQYSTDGGATWSAPGVLLSVSGRNRDDQTFDRLSLAADSADRLHLLAVGYAGQASAGPPQLLHLVWDGARWSPPEVVAEGALYPAAPRALVAGGNVLHVVWHSQNEPSSDTRRSYEVWYSSTVLSAPSVEPQPFFTPVPTVVPTVRPSPSPTLAPNGLPRTAAQAPPVTERPRWEAPGLLILGTALLPALLVVALAAAIDAVRQRL